MGHAVNALRRLGGIGWLAAPYAVAALGLTALPLAMTVVLALHEFDALSAARWVGGANFEALRADPMFTLALENSLLFAAIAVPLRIGIAFALALLLASRGRLARVARPVVYLPSVIPEIAYALLWLWLLNPLYGPASLFAGSDRWLLTPWGARGALFAMSLLQIGEVFIVLLAVRREVPRELYEQAAVDGASSVRAFRAITLPALWPAVLLLALRDVALTLQTTFVPALVVTRGGPLYATTFLPLYAYQSGFEYLRFGYASAMTVVTIALTLMLLAAQWAVVELWRGVRGAGK